MGARPGPPRQQLVFALTHYPVGDLHYELHASLQDGALQPGAAPHGPQPVAAPSSGNGSSGGGTSWAAGSSGSSYYYRVSIREAAGSSCYTREQHVAGEDATPQALDKYSLEGFRQEIARWAGRQAGCGRYGWRRPALISSATGAAH